MCPDRLGPLKLQFTIGRVMSLIAVMAIFLAITPSGLAALIMFSLSASYYLLFRYVLPGRSLPQRNPVVKGLSRSRWVRPASENSPGNPDTPAPPVTLLS
jgi:hypothetical protein